MRGAELKFLSGVFRKSRWGEESDEDLRLGETIRDYWTRFAKSGNPNGLRGPYWLAFDARNELCLEIGRAIKSRAAPDRDVAPELHVRGQRFCVFSSHLRSDPLKSAHDRDRC